MRRIETAGPGLAEAARRANQRHMQIFAKHRDHITDIAKLVASYSTAPLGQDLIINSVPKSGTMLLRNILLTFVPADSIHWPFVNDGSADTIVPTGKPRCFSGHLPFGPNGLRFAKGKRHVLIMRHPHRQILSYARYIQSPDYRRDTKTGAWCHEQGFTFDELVRLVITGFKVDTETIHSVRDIYVQQVLGWQGHAHVVRYEDLTRAVADMDEGYFTRLLGAAGLPMTEDWRERVRLGANPRLSSTSSQNFEGDARKRLTDEEKALFDVLAPGLCEALGY